MTLHVSIYDRLDQIDPAQWDALALRMREPSIYHTHDWARLWLEHFGKMEGEEGVEVRLLVVREGEELIALLPMMIRTQRRARLLSRKILTCLSSSSAAWAQYLGPICSASHEPEAEEALRGALAELEGFDAIYFENYLPSNALARLIGTFGTSSGFDSSHRSGLYLRSFFEIDIEKPSPKDPNHPQAVRQTARGSDRSHHRSGAARRSPGSLSPPEPLPPSQSRLSFNLR
jgi:hypothetical protein